MAVFGGSAIAKGFLFKHSGMGLYLCSSEGQPCLVMTARATIVTTATVTMMMAIVMNYYHDQHS